MNLLSIPQNVLRYSISKTQLSFIENYALRLTCKTLSIMLVNVFDIDKIIRNEIKKYVKNGDIFADALYKHKHYVVGSLVLRCLTGETWRESDMDIKAIFPYKIYSGDKTDMEWNYKYRKTYQHQTEFIRDAFGYEDDFTGGTDLSAQGIDYTGDTDLSAQGIDYTGCAAASTLSKIDEVRNFEGYVCIGMIGRKYKIKESDKYFDYNLIMDTNENGAPKCKNACGKLKGYDSVLNHIAECADMEFTKVAYNGRNVKIRNLDSILLKTCIVDVESIPFRPPDAYFPDMQKTYCLKLLQRVKKYQLRGYSPRVVFDPSKYNSDEMRRDIPNFFKGLHREDYAAYFKGNSVPEFTQEDFDNWLNKGVINF